MRPAGDGPRAAAERRSRVAAFLAAHPGPWTTGSLAVAVGMHGSTLDRVLAGLADEGAVLSTRRLGLMAGPALLDRSPAAPGTWESTLGAVAEPYLAEVAGQNRRPLEFAVAAGPRHLLLARWEHDSGLVFAGDGAGAAHPAEAEIDLATASTIRTLRGRVLLGARHDRAPVSALELRVLAQRLQHAMARPYPLVTGLTSSA